MFITKTFLREQFQKHQLLYEKADYIKRAERDEYDVFVSYSWNDREYADMVVQLLEKLGYTVYIDYNDYRLDRGNVSKNTAECIIKQMKKCKGLLYLYSPNASISKWCPWEVGVFSGMKNFRCANFPLMDNQNDDFKKQEYLEIYPYVKCRKNSLIDDLYLYENEYKYVKLREWLNGKEPTFKLERR